MRCSAVPPNLPLCGTHALADPLRTGAGGTRATTRVSGPPPGLASWRCSSDRSDPHVAERARAVTAHGVAGRARVPAGKRRKGFCPRSHLQQFCEAGAGCGGVPPGLPAGRQLEQRPQTVQQAGSHAQACVSGTHRRADLDDGVGPEITG